MRSRRPVGEQSPVLVESHARAAYRHSLMASLHRSRPYRVTVHRDGRWWHVRVPELGIATQAHNLAEVPAQARELIGVWIGAQPAIVRVTVHRRGRPGSA